MRPNFNQKVDKDNNVGDIIGEETEEKIIGKIRFLEERKNGIETKIDELKTKLNMLNARP